MELREAELTATNLTVGEEGRKGGRQGIRGGRHRLRQGGYAGTNHFSQGQTADRVLTHADTELGAKDPLNNRMAYVAVSRGAYDAQMDGQRCLSTVARTICARISGRCRVAQPPVVSLPHGVDGDAIR